METGGVPDMDRRRRPPAPVVPDDVRAHAGQADGNDVTRPPRDDVVEDAAETLLRGAAQVDTVEAVVGVEQATDDLDGAKKSVGVKPCPCPGIRPRRPGGYLAPEYAREML